MRDTQMKMNRDLPFARITADCIAAKAPLPKMLASQFERIAKQLNAVWGTKAAIVILDELIFSKRPDRRGFPPDVAAEIVALKTLHEKNYAATKTSPWDSFSKLYEATDTKPVNFNGHENVDPEFPEAAPQSVYIAKNTVTKPAEQPTPVLDDVFPAPIADTTSLQPFGNEEMATERQELLEDAGRLMEDGRIHSAIALFERVLALYPRYALSVYLRLLEIYLDLGRRAEFELVSLRMSHHFNCKQVRWAARKEEYRLQLDRVAKEMAQQTSAAH